MAAVDIDRQAIERRDFPIGRRGYDPAAVDAHLRALANEIEELQRARIGGGAEASLASTAGSQVQSILAAAETAAADIERQAVQTARTAREEADRDAARTREEAIKHARAHVAAVAQATSVLLERVSSMDDEVSALVESLRAGASRLAGDLAALETNMGELYDAASRPAPVATDREPSPPARGIAAAAAGVDPSPEQTGAARAAAPATPSPAVTPSGQPPPPSAAAEAAPAQAPTGTPTVENGDLDGARLIALNMALNGESRADAERYLAEHFQLANRQKLIDEVYAAIEE
jgi:cell division septum initiation protein DivIVA